MAKVALNTMVAAETLEAIRGMATGKSQGQVVDEAIAALQGGDKHGEVNRWFRETWTRLDEILETVQSEPPFVPNVGAAYVMPSSVADPASIPGVSVGPPKAPVIIKRYKCEHCGTTPAVPRVGEICETCRENRHQGGVRDCPICADYGTGAA